MIKPVSIILLILLIVILGICLLYPGPKTAGFELVIPVPPPLVRLEDTTLHVAKKPDNDLDEIPRIPKPGPANQGILDDIDRDIIPMLKQIAILENKIHSLEGNRGRLKLQLEGLAVQIAKTLPDDQLMWIYNHRMALVWQYGHMAGVESRQAIWSCPEGTSP